MKLHELIHRAATETDDVIWQIVQQNIVQAQTAKHGQTRLTILTGEITPTQIMNGDGPIGIIVWVPKETYRRLAGD